MWCLRVPNSANFLKVFKMRLCPPPQGQPLAVRTSAARFFSVWRDKSKSVPFVSKGTLWGYFIIFCISSGLSLFPGCGGEKQKYREELKSARKHIKDQNDLRKRREKSEIRRRSDRFKSRSDVIQAGCDRRKIGGEADRVQRNKNR